MTIAQFAGKRSTTSPGRHDLRWSNDHRSLLQERDVLPVQDTERLLERLDLLLAARHAVLVAHASVHARRLELVVVRKSRVELLLRALQVRLLRSQRRLLVGLLRRLVLHVLRVPRSHRPNKMSKSKKAQESDEPAAIKLHVLAQQLKENEVNFGVAHIY